MVVVVKAAHQTRIDRVLDPQSLNSGFEHAEEPAGIFAQEVKQTRRSFDHRLHFRVFGIENTQRIGRQTTAGILIEHIVVFVEVGHQRFAVTGAFFGRAEAVQLQARLDAEVLPQTCGERQELDVHVRAAEAQRFAAELIELTIAAALRALVPKHRAEVPQTLRCVVGDVVLDRAAAHGTRSFRTQRQLLAVHRVGKGIHFLFHDVGGFAHAAGKKARRFQNRRTDLAVSVGSRHGARRVFKFFPDGGVFGEHVVHALDAGDLDFCHFAVPVFLQMFVRRRPTIVVPSVGPRTLRSWP